MIDKSTLSSRDLRINEATIDSIFGAPGKIHIPERYIPDTVSGGKYEKMISKKYKISWAINFNDKASEEKNCNLSKHQKRKLYFLK